MTQAASLRRDLPELDYDTLYSQYQSGLIHTLRGFGPAAACLELWVPDENPLQGVLNMLDAAAEVGQTELAVRLGADSAGRLNAESLLRAARDFGSARLIYLTKGLVLEVRELKSPRAPERLGPRAAGYAKASVQPYHEEAPVAAPPVSAPVRADPQSLAPDFSEPLQSIGPAYQAAVGAALRRARTEYRPEARQGWLSIRGSIESAASGDMPAAAAPPGPTLTLLVDPSEHRIRDAGFHGARSGLERALLDRLCVLSVGLPIQDASDHAVLRLEYDLRDTNGAPPVMGVVTPMAADPAFGLPLRLMRGAVSAYRERQEIKDTDNEYDRGPGEVWLQLSDADRRALVYETIVGHAPRLGLEPRALRIKEIQFDVRIVLSFSTAASDSGHGFQRAALVMQLERLLQREVNPRLELYLEEQKDRNKLRRLAVVEPNR